MLQLRHDDLVAVTDERFAEARRDEVDPLPSCRA